MQYYIRVWSNQSASLIAEDGHTLDTFESLDDAIDACIRDCRVEPSYIERRVTTLDTAPLYQEALFH